MLNVDYARKRRRWIEKTQAEIAEEVGVEAQTVSRWETGEREPRSGQLIAWAHALGIPVSKLLSDEPAAEEVAG